MTTELLKQDIKFDVEVNTKIEMKNEETLNKLVSEVESKYEGIVYNEDTIEDAKKDKSSLKKVVKSIEDERKRIKRGYNEPLDFFEKKMKVYVDRLNKVIDPIDDDVKAYEESQKLIRKEEVQTLINENASNFNLVPEDIEIQDGWLLKSLKGVKRVKAITDEMKCLQQKKEHLENEISIITAYCSALKLDNGGWLAQIKQGASSPDVIKLIDEFNQQEKERIELENKRAIELKMKERQEAEKTEKERIELEKVIPIEHEDVTLNEQVIGNFIQPQTKQVVIPETETLVLKITGTSQQLDSLSDYIIELGLAVETV